MASDDYMHPTRLQIHYNHFKNEECIVSCHPIGVFYNINNGKLFIYDGFLKDKFKLFTKWAHPSMAFRTTDIKRIKVGLIFRGIDGHIYKEIKRIYGSTFDPIDNISYYMGDDWKFGFFTDGMNNISDDRILHYNKSLHNTIHDLTATENNNVSKLSGHIFFCNPVNECTSKQYNYTYITDYIPQDVYEKLSKLKNY